MPNFFGATCCVCNNSTAPRSSKISPIQLPDTLSIAIPSSHDENIHRLNEIFEPGFRTPGSPIPNERLSSLTISTPADTTFDPSNTLGELPYWRRKSQNEDENIFFSRVRRHSLTYVDPTQVEFKESTSSRLNRSRTFYHQRQDEDVKLSKTFHRQTQDQDIKLSQSINHGVAYDSMLFTTCFQPSIPEDPGECERRRAQLLQERTKLTKWERKHTELVAIQNAALKVIKNDNVDDSVYDLFMVTNPQTVSMGNGTLPMPVGKSSDKRRSSTHKNCNGTRPLDVEGISNPLSSTCTVSTSHTRPRHIRTRAKNRKHRRKQLESEPDTNFNANEMFDSSSNESLRSAEVNSNPPQALSETSMMRNKPVGPILVSSGNGELPAIFDRRKQLRENIL